MKKLIYILICVLLTAALAVTVFAEETVEMILDTAQKTVIPGETMAFTVTLGAMEDCRSAGFTLSYDETVFEFLDGSCTAKDTLISSLKDGTGVFTYGDPRPVSGEIFAFRLKVKENATVGSYSITAKGSARDTNGAVSTKFNGVTLTVAAETAATSQPTVAEREPEAQTQPTAPEATQPEAPTEPVSTQDEPVKDTLPAAMEEPVYTIGADSADPEAPFPWWIVAAVVAAVAVAAGIVFVGSKKN